MGGTRGDLASYGSRVGATLIDALLIGLVAFTVALVAGAAGADPEDASTYVVALTLLSNLLYGPLFLTRSGARNGQTPGKQVARIRVVREDAEPVGAQVALTREFLGKGVLGLVPFFTIVDYLFPLGDARRQALHDKLAKTFVVHADAVPELAEDDAFGRPEAITAPDAPAGWAPPAGPEATPEPARAPAPKADVWAPPAPAPPAPPVREDDPEIRGPFGPSSS